MSSRAQPVRLGFADSCPIASEEETQQLKGSRFANASTTGSGRSSEELSELINGLYVELFGEFDDYGYQGP